jgi:hypothetical protein
MQLMPATAAAFNVSDPFDPQQNILGGAAYLRQLMDRYSGDASLALSAYNAGPQIVDRIAGIPDIPETQNYVTSIFRDLGWRLPARPALTTDPAWGPEPEIQPDVTTDTVDQDVAPSETAPERKAADPAKENQSISPSPKP